MKLFSNSGKYCKPKTKTHSKKTSFWKLLLSIVVIACAVFACVFFLHSCVNSENESAVVPTIPTEETASPTLEETTESTLPLETTEPVESTQPEETDPPVKEILPEFQELYQRNPEFYGWLTLDGTNIDYPVMYSPDDNYKYLHADFDGNYSFAGIPYLDTKCTSDSDNFLIYGHNMNDGSMFHTLFRYERESFWEEHPTFVFSDLYQEYEYEVLAVFRDQIYKKTDTCFKFYQFIDAENEEDFNYAISQLKEKSIYDTGVVAEYGDKLITLITCAYHVDNGRFVVVGRRK